MKEHLDLNHSSGELLVTDSIQQHVFHIGTPHIVDLLLCCFRCYVYDDREYVHWTWANMCNDLMLLNLKCIVSVFIHFARRDALSSRAVLLFLKFVHLTLID